MLGQTTPDPDPKNQQNTKNPSIPHDQVSSRSSFGEFGARSSMSPPAPRGTSSQPVGQSKTKVQPTQVPRGAAAGASPTDTPKSPKKYINRMTEAKACLMKAKLHLGNSRNLKTEIKTGVTEAVDRLYALVKEAEEDRAGKSINNEKEVEVMTHPSEVIQKLEEHAKLLQRNSLDIERLTTALKNEQESRDNGMTYASVVAGSSNTKPAETACMHSIVVASKNDQETGDQVFERLRKVVNAREEGTRIDRIRKVRDRKIIIGCRNEEEMRKVKERIGAKENNLSVEDIKSKDPLIILYGVLNSNTDEDILKAIRVQNKHLLKEVAGDDDRIEIRYRRRARNPLTSHVVAKVSPKIWQSLTNAGAVHVDMQRIRVADQSPLVQCSRCLGYGHGKRFCTEAVDVCSHCGGEHLRSDCPEELLVAPPSCINCAKAKMGRGEHNAFSNDCPVRRKWDSLARSTVAYC
ncbi:uncharacterized protein [Epargyreus clarus]|uniref:uncharacterized protein n=1 Tax=Epargyreus clarus TaxID=520877 RepID=UPI003C2AC372